MSTRLTPAEVIKFATSFAEMGTRGWSLRSWRAYPKNGITAMMRPALARRAASTMMRSSITLWFDGGQVGWMMKTSSPRMFSLIFTKLSPSGNAVTSTSDSG